MVVGHPEGMCWYRACLLLMRGRIFSPPQLFVQVLISEFVSCSVNLASKLAVRVAWLSPVHTASEGRCIEDTHWKNLIWSLQNTLILANPFVFFFFLDSFFKSGIFITEGEFK